MVTFTGSTALGKLMLKYAALSNLKVVMTQRRIMIAGAQVDQRRSGGKGRRPERKRRARRRAGLEHKPSAARLYIASVRESCTTLMSLGQRMESWLRAGAVR
jgi:hypothetical protein